MSVDKKRIKYSAISLLGWLRLFVLLHSENDVDPHFGDVTVFVVLRCKHVAPVHPFREKLRVFLTVENEILQVVVSLKPRVTRL